MDDFIWINFISIVLSKAKEKNIRQKTFISLLRFITPAGAALEGVRGNEFSPSLNPSARTSPNVSKGTLGTVDEKPAGMQISHMVTGQNGAFHVEAGEEVDLANDNNLVVVNSNDPLVLQKYDREQAQKHRDTVHGLKKMILELQDKCQKQEEQIKQLTVVRNLNAISRTNRSCS
jgi:hypothetical protein